MKLILPKTRSETGNKSVAETTGRTALLKLSRVDRETIWPCGASERNLGDRETDSVAKHEEIRPETH